YLSGLWCCCSSRVCSRLWETSAALLFNLTRQGRFGAGALQPVGRQALAGAGAEQLELFGAADQIAAAIGELVACAQVGLVQLLQAAADLVQVLDEGGEFVVQRPGAFGDLTGVLALPFLAPEAVDHPQRGQQRGRADD